MATIVTMEVTALDCHSTCVDVHSLRARDRTFALNRDGHVSSIHIECRTDCTINRLVIQIEGNRLVNRDKCREFDVSQELNFVSFSSRRINSGIEGLILLAICFSHRRCSRHVRRCNSSTGFTSVDRHFLFGRAVSEDITVISLEGEGHIRVRINFNRASFNLITISVIPLGVSRSSRDRHVDLSHSELDGVAINVVAETFRSSGEFSEINLCSICAGDNLSTSTSTFRKCKGHISRERNSARGINALNRAVRISDCHITFASERW